MAQISIFTGSVYGGALLTARALKKDLTEAGHQIRLFEAPELEQLTSHDDAILVCTSTTGQGELPSNLVPFWAEIRDKLPLQNGRPFGVIVLGDSSYGDTYCGAGELMEEALYEIACRKVGDTLRIDAMETVEPEAEALPWAREWAKTLDQTTT
ncbi:flavodoxin [Tamilnaduibacter salinus]|uniref:Flavodoxin n=1 Tax=Tamilnaduibacter salinus TaxID=1484056 RepID=A0A2A2I248_9GAMM|nr:flavodoxin [Tamilnaduibacter salinus]PAV25672.1 flavodoxin [Tamilnaduibacter salinus]PVY76355.1 flavodoxin [Tamilnaduibacter salinus]